MIRKASLAHHKFFLALKRDQIEVCTLNIRGLKYDFLSTLSLLSFTQNFTHLRNFGQKHELQYLDKICTHLGTRIGKIFVRWHSATAITSLFVRFEVFVVYLKGKSI